MAKRMVYLMLSCVLAVHTVHGLRCYQCHPNGTEDCQNRDDNSGLSIECPYSEFSNRLYGPVCIKITGKKGQFVARDCSPPGSANKWNACEGLGLISKFSAEGDPEEEPQCYSCDTDHCNSANQYTGLGFMSFCLATIALTL